MHLNSGKTILSFGAFIFGIILATGIGLAFTPKATDVTGTWLATFPVGTPIEPKIITVERGGDQVAVDLDGCDPGQSILLGHGSASGFSVDGYDAWGDYITIEASITNAGLSGNFTWNGQGPISWTATQESTDSYCPAFTVPTASINVNGDGSDWAGINPALQDDAGDGNGTAGSDLVRVYMAKDELNAYFRIDVADGPPSSEKFYGISIYNHKYPHQGDKYIHFDMSRGKVYIYSRIADGSEYGANVAQGEMAMSSHTIEASVPLADLDPLDEAFVYAWSDYEGVDNGIDSTGWTKARFMDQAANSCLAVILTVDGLSPAQTLLGLISNETGVDYGLEVGQTQCYLLDNLKTLDWGNAEVEIHCFDWSPNDPYQSPEVVTRLIDSIEFYQSYAREKGGRFIVVGHSWGTFLAYMALSLSSGLNPDLFITLSAPQGSYYAPTDQAMPQGVADIINLFVYDREEEITGWDRNHKQDLYYPRATRWVNYWAWGDVLSGPMQSYYSRVEDIMLPGPIVPGRRLSQTGQWHAYTACRSDIKMPGHEVHPDIFDMIRETVRRDILNTMTGECEVEEPPAIKLRAPTTGSQVDSSNVNLQWEPVEVDDSQYRIQFWGNNIDLHTAFPFATSHKCTWTLPYQTYYWRVQTGTKNWSPIWFFETIENN